LPDDGTMGDVVQIIQPWNPGVPFLAGKIGITFLLRLPHGMTFGYPSVFSPPRRVLISLFNKCKFLRRLTGNLIAG
jgi:hypothetical protein